MRVFYGLLPREDTLDIPLKAGHHAWLQLVDGRLELNEGTLEEGDGAAVSEEDALRLVARKTARFLLLDLT